MPKTTSFTTRTLTTTRFSIIDDDERRFCRRRPQVQAAIYSRISRLLRTYESLGRSSGRGRG
jgi:hypothetical protein